MNIVKQLLKTLVKVILVTLLSYNIYNFYCTEVLHKKVATVNGYGLLEVVSGSMKPTININDLIIINTEDKSYQINDIVTFYDVDEALVTHRIIAISDNWVITKGDNNNTPDEKISRDKIIGKYVKKVSGLGKVITSLKSPIVMIIVLLVGIMVCIFISTKEEDTISKEDKEEFLKYQKKVK